MGFEALKCCMQEEPPSLPSCSKPSFLQVTAGTRRDRWSVTLLWQKETCGMIFLPKYHNYSTSFKSDQTSGSFFVFTFLTFWREGLNQMPMKCLKSNYPPGGHFFCIMTFKCLERWLQNPFGFVDLSRRLWNLWTWWMRARSHHQRWRHRPRQSSSHQRWCHPEAMG